ncbi:MAG: hypothetical protein R3Y53_10620 [Bacillota bacterium]
MNQQRKQYLKYFCLQYKNKKKQLDQFNFYKSPDFQAVGKSFCKDNHENLILKKLILEYELQAVDDCIEFVADDLSPYLFDNVINEKQFEYLDVPTSRRSFYRMKSKFFKMLNEKIL